MFECRGFYLQATRFSYFFLVTFMTFNMRTPLILEATPIAAQIEHFYQLRQRF